MRQLLLPPPTTPPTPFSFALPAELAAREPPERRGENNSARDRVRLMVINKESGAVTHTRFDRLGEFLRPEDVLVLNSSRTLPASLRGRCRDVRWGCPSVEVRLAEHLPDGSWLALILRGDGETFAWSLRPGMELDFGRNLTGRLGEPDRDIPRLRRIQFSQTGAELIDSIYQLGRPIRYEHVSGEWGLDYYQTVYAREPGSAEMPSAGRAFTWQLLLNLKRQGVRIAFVVLHAGLSSYMDDQLDALHLASEEAYFISPLAAEQINNARGRGGRVIAVGTTVVRALESAADELGKVQPHQREQLAYTRLRVTAEHRLKVVDGLLTGLHEPAASHLDLLSAFLPAAKIKGAYEEAVGRRYLWHEFGDLNLIL